MSERKPLEPISDPDEIPDDPAAIPDGDSDFASEHESTTVSESRHGPEGTPESESPKGLGGMD